MPERGRCFSMEWVTLSGPVAVDENRLEAPARNSAGEKGEQKDERDSTGHMARRSSASGSAAQGLWLKNGKVRPQVSGIDRSQFPGRGTVGKVRRGGRRASNSAKKRVHRFRVRFG